MDSALPIHSGGGGSVRSVLSVGHFVDSYKKCSTSYYRHLLNATVVNKMLLQSRYVSLSMELSIFFK